ARAAARELSRPRGRVEAAVRVPALPSTRTVLPSILVLLTESVRASDYCSSPGAACSVAPKVAALLPDRIAFDEMRAVSSYTAVSVGTILSGMLPVGPRDTVLRTPMLFDFMKSARHPARPFSVAYWSAQ